mgnify:FL=1
MYTCKPAKKSLVFMFVLMISVAFALTYLANYFLNFLGVATEIIIGVVWFAVAVFLLVIMPLYFKHTRITVTDKEISKYTFMFTYKYQYMSMDSVTSVTACITPLGNLTGLNCIIVNALGARLLLLCLNKDDCMKITKFFNDIISTRDKV